MLYLVVIIAAMLVLVVAMVLVAWLVSRRRSAVLADPVCGKCGYNVRGLSTFVCPECGADLRDVGIVRPGAAGVSAGASAGGRSAPGRGRTGQPGTTVSRTLSIMFIDMQDYTARTAQTSRDGLINLIRTTRQEVEPVLRKRRGRIVKTMGDGFIVAFDSATDAVLSGAEVQAVMARRNQSAASDDQRVSLRIGVSTGEVALEDGDVYGQAVNTASRIQQVGQPGQVYFSEATYHAMTRSEVPHQVVGDVELKGMPGPTRLYKVVDAIAGDGA